MLQAIRNLLGKRRRDDPAPATHIEDSSKLEETGLLLSSGSQIPKKSKAAEPSKSKYDGNAMSERTKRARRQASKGTKDKSSRRSKPATQAVLRGVVKVRVRKPKTSTEEAGILQHDTTTRQPSEVRASLKRTLSSEDKPRIKRSRKDSNDVFPFLRSKIARTPEVQKAIGELREAEAEVLSNGDPEKTAIFAGDNIFSRQLSLSEQSIRSPLSPKAPEVISKRRHEVQQSISLEESSILRVRRASLSSSRALSSNSEPIKEFARRLSDAARALADGKHKLSLSQSSDTTGENDASETMASHTSTSSLASAMREAVEQAVQKLAQQQEETIKKSEQYIKNESERLATIYKTQPPTYAQSQSNKEDRILYRVAEIAAVQGAEQAAVFYLKLLCEGQLPRTQQFKEPTSDRLWLLMAPQQYPSHFCSTISLSSQHWQRTRSVPLTQEQMYASLKADEARYRSEFITSAVQMIFGGNVERRIKSQYPLHNLLERQKMEEEQEEQRLRDQQNLQDIPKFQKLQEQQKIQEQQIRRLQEQQRLAQENVRSATQAANMLTQATNVPNQAGTVPTQATNVLSQAQPAIAGQTTEGRKPSWAMDVTEDSTGVNSAPVNHTWAPVAMIPFARPEQQITHQAPVAAVRFAIPDQQSTQQAPVATIPFAPRITQSTHSESPINVFARSPPRHFNSRHLQRLADGDKEQALQSVITHHRTPIRGRAQPQGEASRRSISDTGARNNPFVQPQGAATRRSRSHDTPRYNDAQREVRTRGEASRTNVAQSAGPSPRAIRSARLEQYYNDDEL